MTTADKQPSIVQDMPVAEYRAAPGLSNSAIKDLEVSPLRYWFLHVSPDRPVEEPTPALILGDALHCALLEPARFEAGYACELEQENYAGCLVTMDDLRGWIRSVGEKPKGTRKEEAIAQAHALGCALPIWDVIEADHARENEGKVILKPEAWHNMKGCVEALLDEPMVVRLLDAGHPEVSMFATDEETGVALKARLDWARPDVTVDFKSFSQRRGKSIDESVMDALFYEGYLHQAYFYTLVRSLCEPGVTTFVFVFVESEPPHEVRIVEVKPRRRGETQLYWETSRIRVHGLIGLYADCVKRFGNQPWREALAIRTLEDGDIRQLAY